MKKLDELKEIFDTKLKELAINSSIYKVDDFGYITSNNRLYKNYLSNEYWNNFILDMRVNHVDAYKSYNTGKGSELLEQKTPPKMASIASSSRFIYNTLKSDTYNKLKLMSDDLLENGIFFFEEGLKIDNITGTSPQMDCVYYTTNKAIFIEAKCHEFFTDHKICFTKQYFDKGHLTSNNLYSFNIDNKYIEQDYSIKKQAFGYKEDEVLLINVQQALRHMLGIANPTKYSIDYKKELIFLYFKPTILINEIDQNSIKIKNLFDIITNQFKTLFNSKYVKDFCDRYNIKVKLIYSTNDTFESEFKCEIEKLN